MMDYKYIEQLLERYWECQTTLEEEAILRSFFAQDSVPVELLPYRQLFLAEHNDEDVKLGDDFDERIMNIISNQEPVKARTISLSQRLKPLYRAAAVVAIMLTIGTAAQKAMMNDEAPYPTTASKVEVKSGPSVASSDSLHNDSITARNAKQSVITE